MLYTTVPLQHYLGQFASLPSSGQSSTEKKFYAAALVSETSQLGKDFHHKDFLLWLDLGRGCLTNPLLTVAALDLSI